MPRRPLTTFALLLSATVSASAQVGYDWTYEELMEKADAVVIAECDAARDTGRRREHPVLKPGLPVTEWQAAFRVEAILKAQTSEPIGPTVRLRYYRLDWAKWQRANPGLGLVNAGSYLLLAPKSHYLLFLTRSPDGVYEPLSGHAFPIDSAYLLDRNAADLLRGNDDAPQ